MNFPLDFLVSPFLKQNRELFSIIMYYALLRRRDIALLLSVCRQVCLYVGPPTVSVHFHRRGLKYLVYRLIMIISKSSQTLSTIKQSNSYAPCTQKNSNYLQLPFIFVTDVITCSNNFSDTKTSAKQELAERTEAPKDVAVVSEKDGKRERK